MVGGITSVITTNSRYVGSVIQTVQGPDGPRREIAITMPQSKMIQFTYHLLSGGDRPDTLAGDFYGNSDLWWVIADANPEIMDWMDLPLGAVVRIPSG